MAQEWAEDSLVACLVADSQVAVLVWEVDSLAAAQEWAAVFQEVAREWEGLKVEDRKE